MNFNQVKLSQSRVCSSIVIYSAWVLLSFINTFLAFSEVGGYEALIDKYFAAVADDRFLSYFAIIFIINTVKLNYNEQLGTAHFCLL
jgi:hypothetical protein